MSISTLGLRKEEWKHRCPLGCCAVIQQNSIPKSEFRYRKVQNSNNFSEEVVAPRNGILYTPEQSIYVQYTEESSSSQQNGKWCRIDFRFSCLGLNFFCRGTGVSRSYLKCSESKEVRSFHSTLTGSSLLYHILAC